MLLFFKSASNLSLNGAIEKCMGHGLFGLHSESPRTQLSNLSRPSIFSTTLINAAFFNPIDLSRILILLKLDISALFGYTGAVFKKFLGTNLGMFSAFGMLSVWVILPAMRIVYKSKRKDF